MEEQTNAAPKKLTMKDLQEQLDALVTKYEHLIEQHATLREEHLVLAKKFNNFKNTSGLERILKKMIAQSRHIQTSQKESGEHGV